MQGSANNKPDVGFTRAARPGAHPPSRRSGQFESLRASELYCPRCKVARPVRERLLLVLPHADLHEYRCTTCGSSLATREVRHQPKPKGFVG